MTFRPVTTRNSNLQNFGQINDMVRGLNKEQQVKTFNGPGGIPAQVTGRYMEGRYGTLISDSTGTRRILLGQAPDDGRPGLWISKEGEDVITLLS